MIDCCQFSVCICVTQASPRGHSNLTDRPTPSDLTGVVAKHSSDTIVARDGVNLPLAFGRFCNFLLGPRLVADRGSLPVFIFHSNKPASVTFMNVIPCTCIVDFSNHIEVELASGRHLVQHLGDVIFERNTVLVIIITKEVGWHDNIAITVIEFRNFHCLREQPIGIENDGRIDSRLSIGVESELSIIIAEDARPKASSFSHVSRSQNP